MLNSSEDIQYHTKVDKFFCLSTKHKEFVSEHHKIDSNRILITSNGIDFERFKTEPAKDRYKVIYSSSPDRGLENLLNMWPDIKKRIPLLQLHVYYGFDWVKDVEWTNMMMSRMRDLGVHYHGKVNQNELAEAFMTSRVFTAPNWFSETFCIGALECMASGCVYLGSAYWGLLDTVKNSGVLIPMENAMDCTTPNYHARFINELEELINNDVYYNRIQYKGFERVKRFGWEKVALQWHNWFQKKEWCEIQHENFQK
jgi:glycosyltransferase involved in cell wall biosynthesis